MITGPWLALISVILALGSILAFLRHATREKREKFVADSDIPVLTEEIKEGGPAYFTGLCFWVTPYPLEKKLLEGCVVPSDLIPVGCCHCNSMLSLSDFKSEIPETLRIGFLPQFGATCHTCGKSSAPAVSNQKVQMEIRRNLTSRGS